MHGIQKTTVAATVAVHSVAAIMKATGDGFQIGDLFTLTPLLKDAIPVLKGAKGIGQEVADLDTGEAAQLAAAVETAIAGSFAPGHSREIATRSIALIPHLAALIESIQAARQGGAKA